MLAFKTKEDIEFMNNTQVPISCNQNGTENLVVAMEELAELQQQISKLIRGTCKRESLLEEIADSLIVIDRVISYAKITDDELSSYINKKLIKHKERMAHGK